MLKTGHLSCSQDPQESTDKVETEPPGPGRERKITTPEAKVMVTSKVPRGEKRLG